jgi:ankyrin repeat protein
MRKREMITVITVLVVICFSLQAYANQDQADPLVTAAYEGNFKRVRELLDQGVDVNAKNRDGVTALWKTALSASHNKKSFEMAEFLLGKGVDPNFKDKYGRTALMWASVYGSAKFVTLLLDKGADPNDGVPLIGAVHNHHNLEVVKLLLRNGAKANAKNSISWTALTEAAYNNQIDLIQLLLDEGADINATGRLDWTALLWSIYRGHVEMAKLLLERGADANAKTPTGRTALMETAASDYQLKECYDKLSDFYGDIRGKVEGLLFVGGDWGSRHPSRPRDTEAALLLLQHGCGCKCEGSVRLDSLETGPEKKPSGNCRTPQSPRSEGMRSRGCLRQ